MYNLDYFRELSMQEFMERMGFESHGNKYNCPLCGSGTGKNKSSAFIVYPGNRGYYCFACIKGGNVINFMMEWKNLEFKEAIKELAGIYGISEEETDLKPMVYRVLDKERVFYKIEDALKWERKILDESHKENTRRVRVWIADLNGRDIISDSHWLCKCMTPKFNNPTSTQLGVVMDYLFDRYMDDIIRLDTEYYSGLVLNIRGVDD